MDRTVTRELLKKFHACYYHEEGGQEKVNALVPVDGLTPLETAHLNIPCKDRIWVLTRKGVLADAILWEWSARTVERALSRIARTDPRSVAVVPLLRRLAKGEKISRKEPKSAAADAAYAAAAYADAAYAAADAAAALKTKILLYGIELLRGAK